MEAKTLLDNIELIAILFEFAVLMWAMIENWGVKSEKRNNFRRKFSLQLIVYSCAALTLLYIGDFVAFGRVFDVFLGAVWALNVFLWNRSLRNLPNVIKAEKELVKLKEEYRSALEKYKTQKEITL